MSAPNVIRLVSEHAPLRIAEIEERLADLAEEAATLNQELAVLRQLEAIAAAHTTAGTMHRMAEG